MTFVLFVISVIVLEAIVGHPGKRSRELDSAPPPPPAAVPLPDSSPSPTTDLLALQAALEAADGHRKTPLPEPAPSRQPEYNETDVRAE